VFYFRQFSLQVFVYSFFSILLVEVLYFSEYFRVLIHHGFMKDKEKNVVLMLAMGTRSYYEIIEIEK
tara:strand:+ start:150 stop:350 length:201 start_codon:yes stop_codon:yes gene_type:complete